MSSSTDKPGSRKRTHPWKDEQNGAKVQKMTFADSPTATPSRRAANLSKPSNQGSATTHTHSQEDVIKVMEGLREFTGKATDILNCYLETYPQPAQTTSGAQNKVDRAPKKPGSKKSPLSMANKQTSPTDDQPKSNGHSMPQSAPPSDDSAMDNSVRCVVRKEPEQPSQREDIVLACMWFLEMLEKLGCNRSHLLHEIDLVAQALGFGEKGYEAARILYLDLSRLDKYFFPFLNESRCLLTCTQMVGTGVEEHS